MLTKATLKNFKGHADTTISLGKLTVLVGPNGSGKTTVLQAIRLLAMVAQGKAIQTGEGGLSQQLVCRWGQSEPSVAVSGESNGHRYGLSLSTVVTDKTKANPDFALYVSTGIAHAEAKIEWQVDDHHGIPSQEGIQMGLAGPNGDPRIDKSWSVHLQSGSRIFQLNPAVVGAPSSSQAPGPWVEFDGRNVAVVLKAMKLGYDEQWLLFRGMVRKIVPSVENIIIRQIQRDSEEDPVPSRSSHVAPKPSGEWSQIFFDFKGAKGISSEHASEGTLLTVALLAVLLGPSRPSLILLDDIEQTLHPAAQLELMRQIKELLATEEMKGVQIIATTHSPFILDELGFDQVQVFAQREDGTVATKRLDEHPDAVRLKGVVSAGELWTSDPESSWVITP